jgi:hypothetical protein
LLLSVPPKYSFSDDDGVFERQERSSHPQRAVDNEGDVVRSNVLDTGLLCEHSGFRRAPDTSIYQRTGKVTKAAIRI